MPKVVLGIIIVFLGVILSAVLIGTSYKLLGGLIMLIGVCVFVWGWPEFKQFVDTAQREQPEPLDRRYVDRANGGQPPYN